MKINLDTTQYHFTVSGSGQPIWVLLHGFMGTGADFADIAPELPGTVLCPDLLGHGETLSEPKTPFTMAQQIKDLFEIYLTYFAGENPQKMNLVGYSMGGRVAIAFAAAYPELVQHLYLESTCPGLADPEQKAARQAADAQRAGVLKQAGLETFVAHWAQLALFATQQKLPKSVQAKIKQQRLSQRPADLAKSLMQMGTGAQSSEWANLPKFNMPTTLINGGVDVKFTTISSEMMALLPQATQETLPNIGHNVHLEAPAAYLAILKGSSAK